MQLESNSTWLRRRNTTCQIVLVQWILSGSFAAETKLESSNSAGIAWAWCSAPSLHRAHLSHLLPLLLDFTSTTSHCLSISFNTNSINQIGNMASPWWITGSLMGASSVAFGAFGAHGLRNRGVSEAKVASWATAAHYQVHTYEHLLVLCEY